MSFPDQLRRIAKDQPTPEDELTLLMAARRLEQVELALADRRAADVRRSWQGEVDRQGGSFTQDELDAREQW